MQQDIDDTVVTLYVERYHNRVKSGIGSIERRGVQTEEESYYIAHYDSFSNCLVSHSQLSPVKWRDCAPKSQH